MSKINLKFNKKYFIAAMISLLFIICLIIFDTLPQFNWTVINHIDIKHVNDASKFQYPIESTPWVVPLYFTFQSNVLVMIYLFLRAFGIMKPKSNRSHKIFQIITVTNITITMVVYWILLAPFDSMWTHGNSGISKDIIASAVEICSTITVHLIAPIIMLTAFHNEKLKKNEKGIILNYKTVGLVFIYPVLWMLLSVIVYFATRTEHSYIIQKSVDGKTFQLVLSSIGTIKKTFGVGAYFFTMFDLVLPAISIGSPLVIALLFGLKGILFLAVSNPKSKLNQRFKKLKIKFKK